MWTWLRTESAGRGYRFAVVPEHPCADSRGRVLEHRVVMENQIERLLEPDEVVHHLNEDKSDNRSENLAVMLKGDHTVLHHTQQAIELVCAECGETFVRQPRRTTQATRFCSRSCCTRHRHRLRREERAEIVASCRGRL